MNLIVFSMISESSLTTLSSWNQFRNIWIVSIFSKYIALLVLMPCFSIELDPKNPKDSNMYPKWSKARERSNMKFLTLVSSVIIMSTTSKTTNFYFLDKPLIEVMMPFQNSSNWLRINRAWTSSSNLMSTKFNWSMILLNSFKCCLKFLFSNIFNLNDFLIGRALFTTLEYKLL